MRPSPSQPDPDHGDLDLAVRHGVPRSTARGSLREINAEVITLDVLNRSYSHAVTNNVSRRIIAQRVVDSFHPCITAQLLFDALNGLTSDKPMVMVDGCIENFNTAVDTLVKSGPDC